MTFYVVFTFLIGCILVIFDSFWRGVSVRACPVSEVLGVGVGKGLWVPRCFCKLQTMVTDVGKARNT